MAVAGPYDPKKGRTGGGARRAVRIAVLAFLLFIAIAVAIYSPRQGHVSASTARAATVARVVDAPQPSLGCDKPAPVSPGTTGTAAMSSGGYRRTYRLHVPVGYQPAHSYPLVLNFHGHNSTGERQEAYTGFSKLADRYGFIVSYPDGLIGTDGHTGWASGNANRPDVNDVLFVSDLITRLQSQLCIDPLRIYATGFSNGGGMTSLLACRMAGRIAAFAPVSGSYYPPSGGCHPLHPAPILEMHGTSDKIVPYAGEPPIHLLGVTAWLESWAKLDGCTRQPVSTVADADVTKLVWTGCTDGATVIEYRIEGGTHSWPGSPTDLANNIGDSALDASALIWRFFVAHPLWQTTTTTTAANPNPTRPS